MKKLASITLWLLALLVSVCLSACSSDAAMDEQNGPLDGEGYNVTLKLSFLTGASTRAAVPPQGGEDGDGREMGIRHENDINDICVFIFRAANGLDADPATPFLYKGYFAKDAENSTWTPDGINVDVKFKAKGYNEPADGDRIVVIANALNITSAISNLGQLRDYQNYRAWLNGPTLAEDVQFVMSSAYNDYLTDGRLNVTSYEGTEGDPFRAAVTIQRAAARIDFMYKTGVNDGTAGQLTYDVHTDPEDLSSAVIGTMHLQNIIPVNLMQESSYLIKRVTSTDAINSAVRYGALETTGVNGAPTNYVIEPHTLAKQSTVDGSTLDQWYGATRAEAVRTGINSYLTAATSITTYMATTTAQAELGYFTHHMTLAYTNENTQSKEHNDPNFMTGLLLKAVYEPKAVYTDAAATVLDGTNNYAAGHTFWRYSPTSTEMAEKDCKYFENEAAATAYKAAHPEDMAEIDKFTNGVCYYNIWLRHANIDENPHLTFPMEYGIVRNNIYRVGVEKVTGPGTALPEMKEPDHIYLRIFVRKWNLRVQPTIRL